MIPQSVATFDTKSFLTGEIQSLIYRLEQVQPFALSMPMVAAASVSDAALRAVTDHLWAQRKDLRQQADAFRRDLNDPSVKTASDAFQARYATLKMRFNAILDQLDIFADVISQRAEHPTGIWIAGLDILADDALTLKSKPYTLPPVMCFLERGHGAAIRRARTRLPGGDLSPVAIIQVPRERMVGSGIAASLIHEVGHQGAALLNLVESLREAMKQQTVPPQYQAAWTLLNLWLSEIIADFWAMVHLGIGATLGLMGVVSLPRYFMFRIKGDDPHPAPFIRVCISIAFGEILFPDPQWQGLKTLWQCLYPTKELPEKTKQLLEAFTACLPLFVRLVTQHHNTQTRGQPLQQLFYIEKRQPKILRQYFTDWQIKDEHQKAFTRDNIELLSTRFAPSLLFAVIGQARADGRINAAVESRLLEKILRHWALMRAEDRLIHKPAIPNVCTDKTTTPTLVSTKTEKLVNHF